MLEQETVEINNSILDDEIIVISSKSFNPNFNNDIFEIIMELYSDQKILLKIH